MKTDTMIDANSGCGRSGLSRKNFLKLSATAALGAVTLPQIAGCGPVNTGADCMKSLAPAGGAAAKKPFEETSIGAIRLRNRIIRSAVTMNGVDSAGRPKDSLMQHYRDLAQGGAGAIITGMRDGGMMIDNFLFREENFKDFKKVPDIAHKLGTPIIQQLSHHGRQLSMETERKGFINRLSDADIEGIIDLFVRGIDASKRLGFDAAQLHGAHGYLLSDFLSPAKNERTDKWGGALENRFRIVREIITRAEKKAKGFPLWIKMNAYDNQDGGMRTAEAVKIAKMLEDMGIAAIEVSCGIAADGFSTVRVPEIPSEAIIRFSKYDELPSPVKKVLTLTTPLVARRFEPIENYNVCAAREISANVKAPVIVTGGIRKIDDIETILASGAADYVSMGRPFIIEPDIVNRFKNEEHAKSECINCGYCIMAANRTDVKCFYGRL